MTLDMVTVPDFGDVQEIVVVEVYVSVGDKVDLDESLIALESEKAVMDIPAPRAGIVEKIFVQENDIVQSGAPIVSFIQEDNEIIHSDDSDGLTSKESDKQRTEHSAVQNVDTPVEHKTLTHHATPAVRAFAREAEVDLASLVGTGPKGRITKEDVELFVQQRQDVETATRPQDDTVMSPRVDDFSRFGPVETVELPRIKKISGPHLQKSWQSIPHVTQFDEVDISELETFRHKLREKDGERSRYSSLVFIIKAVTAALKDFPLFNSSLGEGGNTVVCKNYYHIGVAVDTDKGLVVPVIRDVDKKGIAEIADELSLLSLKARQSQLSIDQLQGASFTVSSLGGIGGTGFTPIVNAPQVAILGLSRNYMKPVWDKEEDDFIPRLTLPFSVSYDHRVIDGADGVRFCRALAGYIEDLRMILL